MNPTAGAGKSQDILAGEVLCQMVDELCCVKDAFITGLHGGGSGGGADADGCDMC